MESSMTNGPPSIAEESTTKTTPSPPPPSISAPRSRRTVLNLTNVATMTRLLHECTATVRNLDLQLKTLFSQRTISRNTSPISRNPP
ncbi:hypothetical protein Scep_012902 [Stephania cephalantha]|uniref:Uncharacterized protein n=1 Tax=Stephania cephalantha TaxID=152367 RepID=A0AAP0P814_9MAGN